MVLSQPNGLQNIIRGGHGLITGILCDEVDPKTDPLGSENKR